MGFYCRTSTGLGGIEIPLVEGTNRILCALGVQGKGAVTLQETEPDLPASAGGSPGEA